MWRFIIPVVIVVLVVAALYAEHVQASFAGRPPLFTQLQVLLAPVLPRTKHAVPTSPSQPSSPTITVRLPVGFAQLPTWRERRPGILHVSTGYGGWRKESMLGGGVDFHTVEVDIIVDSGDVRAAADDRDLLEHRMFSSTAFMAANGAQPTDVEERADGTIIQRWSKPITPERGHVCVVVDKHRRFRIEVTDADRRYDFAFVEALAVGALASVEVPAPY